jgi:sec-independent protein translocase protein TatA
MFENLGGGEMLLIFLVILILFGPKKIPELATSLGKGLRKFREAKDGLEDQLKTAMKEPMEALQSAKSNFDMHVNAATQQVQETSKALEANVPTQTPAPLPAAAVTPAPPTNTLP